MARIKLGPIVSDIAGKVGDNIFSRNKGGLYVKQYAVPNIPITTYVTSARNAMANAVNAWYNLSETQKLNYESFSFSYPRSTFQDGYQNIDARAFFISNYINQVYAGVTPNPQLISPISLGFQDLEINIPDCLNINFKVNGGSASSDYKMIFYSFQPKSKAVMSLNTVPQYAFHSADYLPDVDINLKTEYLARFFDLFPSEDEKLFGSVRIIHAASGIQVGFGHNRSLGTANFDFNTYGNSGSKINTISGGNQKATKVLLPSAGTITSLTCDLYPIAQDVRFAVYTDNSGVPGTLIGFSQIQSTNGIDSTIVIDLTTPIVIPSSGNYWIAAAASTNVVFYRQFGSGDSSFSPKVGLDFNAAWIESLASTDRFQGRITVRTFISSCISVPYNIGNQDIRGSIGAFTSTRAMPVLTTNPGLISDITIYDDGATGSVQVALFSNSSSLPLNLLAESLVTPLSGSSGWKSIPLVVPYNASASTTYWICLVGLSGASFRYSTSPITYGFTLPPESSFISPWPSFNATSFGASMYTTVVP